MDQSLQYPRPDAINEPLYVVTAIFNPKRFRSRWKLFKLFEKHVIDSGAHLMVVEASFGNREEVITEVISDKVTILHVQTNTELWLKENLLNLGIQNLPKGWKYVATIDADMTFARPDWVGETLQQLQHYPIVQMYSEIVYLSPEYEESQKVISFMEGWRRGHVWANGSKVDKDETYYKRKPVKDSYEKGRGWSGAPGGAWAYRKEALNALGGLMDFCILGSADHYMALGLFGMVEHILRDDFHPEYRQWVLDWQANAVKCIDRNVGHIYGIMFHYWHGSLKGRQYGNRNDVLAKHKYNPRTDLKRDIHGLHQLKGDKWQLRDDVRSYFSARNEDSIDQ